MASVHPSGHMHTFLTKQICPGFRPRQFEYSPNSPELMVFGTIRGEVAVVDHTGPEANIVCADLAATDESTDAILGLCWLHQKDHNMFISGSSKGVLKLCELYSSSGDDGETQHISTSKYKEFKDLTSVHVNCTDDKISTSGYQNNISVYDLESKQIVREYEDIHTDHINITRFTNTSPNIFGTSSFDKTVKMWDLRDSSNRPIYTCRSSKGHIMLCFSPDDLYLLTSAVDNEVRQYLTVDGRLQADLAMHRTGLDNNYTRAYYMNGGDKIISGSSEEDCVRIHCAHTGALLHNCKLYCNRKHESLYIQSLRGDPHCANSFSVLVNYRDSAFPLEIIEVNMDVDRRSGDDVSNIMRSICSSQLSSDMNSVLVRMLEAGKSISDLGEGVVHVESSSEVARKVESPTLRAIDRMAHEEPEYDVYLMPAKDYSPDSGMQKSEIREFEHKYQSPVSIQSNPHNCGHSIPAHSFILSARCNVLAEILGNGTHSTSNFSGSSTNTRVRDPDANRAHKAPLHLNVPTGVSWDTVPTILQYLYTDQVDLSGNLISDFGNTRESDHLHSNEISSNKAYSQMINGKKANQTNSQIGSRLTPHKRRQRAALKSSLSESQINYHERKFSALFDVAFAERLLKAANILELGAMTERIEWWCVKAINVLNVQSLMTMAYACGAVQLLDACLSFLIENLENVIAMFAVPKSCNEAASYDEHLHANQSKNMTILCLSAPYRYLRLPMTLRVRVAVMHSCSSVPLHRDESWDDLANVSGERKTAAGKADVVDLDLGAISNRALLATLQAVSASIEGLDPWKDQESLSLVLEDSVLQHLKSQAHSLKRMGVDTLETAQDCSNCGINDSTEARWEILIPGPVSTDPSEETLQTIRQQLRDALVEASRWIKHSPAFSLLIEETKSESTRHAEYVDKFGLSLEKSATDSNSCKQFPEEPSIISSCSGHTTVSMPRGKMLVTGGHSVFSYPDPREITIYDHATQCWSKSRSFGVPPGNIMHHAACFVDSHAFCRFLLIAGGSTGSRRPQEYTFILDTLTMKWSKLFTKSNLKILDEPEVGKVSEDDHISDSRDIRILPEIEHMGGIPMTPRSGHTIVSMTDIFSVKCREAHHPLEKGTSSKLPDAHAAQEENNLKTKFDSTVMLVVFGGYDRGARECKNDLHVISATPSVSLQEYEQGTSTSAAPHAIYDPCYKYCWRNDLQVTTSNSIEPPTPRLGHTATVLRPYSGPNCSLHSIMVIFGGVGSSHIFDDVHCLDTSRLQRGDFTKSTRLSHGFEWVQVHVDGAPPECRYGHTATAIDGSTILIMGGMNSEITYPMNALHLLHLERVEQATVNARKQNVCHFRWSHTRPRGSPPCQRGRHTASLVYTPEQEPGTFSIIVFGGDAELGATRGRTSSLADRNVHSLQITIAPEWGYKFEWKEVGTSYRASAAKLNRNPIISPSTLGLDFANILSGSTTKSANIWLKPSDSGNSDKLEGGLGFHRFMLAIRSDWFRAMMSSGMQESKTSQIQVNMPRNVMVEFAHYLYGDCISQRALGDPDLLMRLLVVANEYTIFRLARLCEGSILRMLVPENAAAFLEFADVYGVDDSELYSASNAIQKYEAFGDSNQGVNPEEPKKDSIVVQEQWGTAENIDGHRGRRTSILREGCMSFILRNYAKVKDTPEFKCLSERLKTEVEARRTKHINVYVLGNSSDGSTKGDVMSRRF